MVQSEVLKDGDEGESLGFLDLTHSRCICLNKREID